MASDKTNQRLSPNPLPRWGRTYAVAVAFVFLISLVFPLTAGLSKNTAFFPGWWGPLDVAIAFILAIMAFGLVALARGRVTKTVEGATYRAYRVLIHVIFALFVVFLLFGDQIRWSNGLPGIAWRAWLLLYLLPEWLSVMRTASDNPK